jgi:hypothetical protein
MMRENYRIHAGLAATTANSIIKEATNNPTSDHSHQYRPEEGEESYKSNDSGKSAHCHPRRTTKYNISISTKESKADGLTEDPTVITIYYIMKCH